MKEHVAKVKVGGKTITLKSSLLPFCKCKDGDECDHWKNVDTSKITWQSPVDTGCGQAKIHSKKELARMFKELNS